MSNVALREEFERQHARGLMTARKLAALMEWDCPWMRGGRHPDQSRVRRTLGLCEYDPGHGRELRYRERISDATALKFAAALHLDPVEVGL